MSVLNNRQEISQQILAANSIKETAYVLNKRLARFYAEAINLVWNNGGASPQQVCDELGADAKELFELHKALGEFLEANSPDSIAEYKKFIGSYTLNSDGTVTIN
jgi:hypothetical protein